MYTRDDHPHNNSVRAAVRFGHTKEVPRLVSSSWSTRKQWGSMGWLTQRPQLARIAASGHPIMVPPALAHNIMEVYQYFEHQYREADPLGFCCNMSYQMHLHARAPHLQPSHATPTTGIRSHLWLRALHTVVNPDPPCHVTRTCMGAFLCGPSACRRSSSCR